MPKIIKLKLQLDGKEFKECKRFADYAEKLDGGNIEGLEEIISQIEHSSKERGSDTPVVREEAVNILKKSLKLYLELFHPSKEPGIAIRKQGNRDSSGAVPEKYESSPNQLKDFGIFQSNLQDLIQWAQ